MIDFKKLNIMMQKAQGSENLPKHVIINLYPLASQEERKKADFIKVLQLLKELSSLQIELGIPIFTISLGSAEDIPNQREMVNFIEDFTKKAEESRLNVSIFGRWYDLSGELVEAFKKLSNATSDFDSYFLNLCINYEGKREIADACRVIIRKVIDEKADIDSINPELIKENIYSSYFIPPELVIEPSSRFTGTFLWDSAGAKINFLKKPVHEITRSDIQKAISLFSER